MKSFIIKLFLFSVLVKIRAEPEKNINPLLSKDHSKSYEAWNKTQIMQAEVTNFPSVIKTDNPSTYIDDFLLEKYPSENDTSSCSNDIAYVLGSLVRKEVWAIRMIDSYGKVGSGILEGNLAWPGSYHECISVQANSSNGIFQGRYCTVSWSIRITNSIIAVSSGTCFPSTCSASQLNEGYTIIKDALGNFSDVSKFFPDVNITSITCKPLTKELNAPSIFMLFLIAFFGLMALLGSSVTVYEYFQNIIESQYNKYSCEHKSDVPERSEEIIISEGSNNTMQATSNEMLLIVSEPENTKDVFKKVKAVLKSFCIFTNGAKILNTDTGEGQLLCIHGIRFLSMSWIILGHTYMFIAQSVPVVNPLEAVDDINNLPFQIVGQGFFAVDSFFILSGFLLTYLYCKEMVKRGKMSWVYFYVHRYLRLTPVYMIVLGFSVTLTRYISFGPFSGVTLIDTNCETYWWRNILYINNLFDANTMCMSWSWYLANDMQFYVISPLFLYALWRKPKIGFLIIGLFLTASTICSFVITYEYDLVTGITEFSKGANFRKLLSKFSYYFDKLYIKPYGRIGPYLIGMLLGYVFFKYKKALSLLVLFFGWIIATSLTLLIVYGLYHTSLNIWAASLYNAFGRLGFSLGLSWVIYVCLTSGGPVNQILSFKGFIPLSRLTYCAYLIHPMIILAYYENQKTPLYFFQLTQVVLFLGLICVTYAIAFLTTLLFESPIMGLEKEIRKLFTKTTQEESSAQQNQVINHETSS